MRRICLRTIAEQIRLRHQMQGIQWSSLSAPDLQTPGDPRITPAFNAFKMMRCAWLSSPRITRIGRWARSCAGPDGTAQPFG